METDNGMKGNPTNYREGSKRVILEAKGLDKKFISRSSTKGDSLRILDSLDITIYKGETAAIVGVSGSGKTTLLSLLAGLDLPNDGVITIDGIDITKLSEAERSIMRANKLSFVFQDFILLPHLSALENVMLPLEMKGIKDAAKQSSRELERVGLGDRLNHYPNQLSGGEQQRCALARAFAAKPLILFADEPSGNLDLTTGKQISTLMFNLNQENNTTLVLVTHDMKLASLCNKVYELKKGKLSIAPISQK